MRLATLLLRDGSTTAAADVDQQWRRLAAPDVSALLSSPLWRAADLPHDRSAYLATQLGPVVEGLVVNPLPRPAKVVCCGLNYGDHIRETGRELPTHPTLFAKFADTLNGPTDEISLPADVLVDWEAELAVVVGATLSGADRDTAARAIAGYTVANDISVRDWQRRTLQWFQGKAWDATTPCGPVVVTADELDPSAGLDVVCRVDGVEVQRGDTSTLVFDAPDLLAYISTFTSLAAGDLVLTGTPGGVGLAMTPPVYLRDGQLVETEVEAIGTLRNLIRLRSRTRPTAEDATSPAHPAPASRGVSR